MDDRRFRREFYQRISDQPLDPDDPRYFQIYDGPENLISNIREIINFSENQSTQLLSGYRGGGKSTELRRLRRDLQKDGYKVVLIDIEEYLDLHTPIDITDFMFGLCGALGEELKLQGLLEDNELSESAWARFAHWMKSDINLKEFNIKTAAPGFDVGIKAELKGNPTFRRRLRNVLSSSVGRFASESQNFVLDCAKAIKKRHGESSQLVILVDSMEHVRGTNDTEQSVHSGMERLFSQHDDKVRFPGVHIVYTVPPWLQIRCPNIGSLYDGKGLYILPAQKVRKRDIGDQEGVPHQLGIDQLIELVTLRGDWKQLLGEQKMLEKLILNTGGHLRDLMRLLRIITVQTDSLPAKPETIENTINQLRMQFLPIANDDARWLAQIARSRTVNLESIKEMGTLSRYFDSHLVLSYLNGEAWYDVHPLVREIVLQQANSEHS